MNSAGPYQRGFSMIEVMVASAIGLILLAGATTLLVHSSTSYQTTDSIARLQENARFAIDYLSRDLRNAGNFGCLSDVDTMSSSLNSWDVLSAQQVPYPLDGLEAGTTTWYPSGAAANAVSSSDRVIIRYADNNGVHVTQPMPNEAGNLFVNPGHDLHIGDVIMVSDCDSADILQLTNLQSTGGNDSKDGIVHNSGIMTTPPGNAVQRLSKVYDTNATIFKFNNIEYAIKKGRGGVPALFRSNQELVEGIENMQILYGLDESGNRRPTRYVTANQITTADQWRNVVSVRIGLLVSAIVNNPSGGLGNDENVGPYDLNLTSSASDDVDPAVMATEVGVEFRKKIARQQFFTTINLRNAR